MLDAITVVTFDPGDPVTFTAFLSIVEVRRGFQGP